MSIRGKAFIAGAFEHPARRITDKSMMQVHTEVILGALADAGLGIGDVDGFFCGARAPGANAGRVVTLTMAEYLGIQPRYMDSTEMGGSSYISHIGHAAAAIAAGKCSVAVISLAGLTTGNKSALERTVSDAPESPFEDVCGAPPVAMYALAARRHMHEFGTTSAQLAEIRVAASHHAQFNERAVFRTPVTVEEVLASPFVSDPLRRLDCCVVTDGGGALVVVSPEIARDLKRRSVKVLGHGESPKTSMNGAMDLTYTGAVWSGPTAYAEAGITPADVDYASIYDSFTITVLESLEDLGFCAKGQGGRFVMEGNLISGVGKLPINTDGGGLCNNHPGNRGGMTKVIEAVRQLRGEAHPAVQVKDCRIALAHGTGGSLATRHGSATVILGTDDA
ncbi:MAG: thiolase domain-containing protein [Sphingomonadales bacterium]|nr:MAG: thiolase domain-containing protein [Sphingomonadales bacterium]